MKKEEKKSEKKHVKPRVHTDLKGFEVEINQFGEIRSNMNIEKINEFLNKNVDDKKLAEREDYDEMKKGELSKEERDKNKKSK